MKVSGLIIAAGFSGRMNSFKPILKINDKSLVQLITEKLLNVCEEVIIVTGHNRDLVEEVMKKSTQVKFVHNENYRQGMFTSLKKGLIEASDSDWVLYHFVDQPTLPEKFYYEIVNHLELNFDWIQPTYNDIKGHPIVLNNSIFQIIINADNTQSLKQISQSEKIKRKYWACNYPQILEDIDTKEDLEKIIFHQRK